MMKCLHADAERNCDFAISTPSAAKPSLLRVQGAQVEAAGAPKSRPKGTKAAEVGSDRVANGVGAAKVAAIGSKRRSELWKPCLVCF
mgnify:CR=1 FL=1